jgi:hypothetical protein
LRARNADLDIELKEYSFGEDKIDLSNTVKINGKDIMDILGEKQRVLNACPSCTDLIGKETECNTYVYRVRFTTAFLTKCSKKLFTGRYMETAMQSLIAGQNRDSLRGNYDGKNKSAFRMRP